ncbi:hypothetical protein D9615_002652 [Tricholomella constricta]|uniref:Uncharacterized protein n=1 Tax=Tricholomella constricta TaxID=117010 RepID=A0A8H5M9W7_9AGAR|nr:hypothetical protein D9615_002652 [Tricholomella constricta]
MSCNLHPAVMPLTSSAFESRVEHGLYDIVADQIIDMGKKSLAGADYNIDFARMVEPYSGNYLYKAKCNNSEFRVVVFGQICLPDAGTILSAKGNHYGKWSCGKFLGVTDDSKVKDVLVLGVPSLAPELLSVLFYNQIGTLNDIRESDEKEEAEEKQPKNNVEPVGHKDTGKYYGGPYFKHVYNKLVQHAVRDIENKLIPPWKNYDALRPGTFVLANCTLHCFMMKEGTKVRKVYQINTHSLRVLGISDSEVYIPARPTIPVAPEMHSETKVASSSASSSGDAFFSFSLSKKRKNDLAHTSSLTSRLRLDEESEKEKEKDLRNRSKDNDNEPVKRKEKEKGKGKKANIVSMTCGAIQASNVLLLDISLAKGTGSAKPPFALPDNTSIQLVEHFYDPLAGEIFLDDERITKLNVQEYRKQIMLVLQEPTLSAGTVRFNILLGAIKPECEVTQEGIKKVRIVKHMQAVDARQVEDTRIDSGGDFEDARHAVRKPGHSRCSKNADLWALQTSSDVELLRMLQDGREDMPKAIKMLQRALERVGVSQATAVMTTMEVENGDAEEWGL